MIHVDNIYTVSPCLSKMINISFIDVPYIYLYFNIRGEICVIIYTNVISKMLKKQHGINIHICDHQVPYIFFLNVIINVLFNQCATNTSLFYKQIQYHSKPVPYLYCLPELIVKFCINFISLIYKQMPFSIQLTYLLEIYISIGAIIAISYLLCIMFFMSFSKLTYILCHYICRSLQITKNLCVVQLNTLLQIKHYYAW